MLHICSANDARLPTAQAQLGRQRNCKAKDHKTLLQTTRVTQYMTLNPLVTQTRTGLGMLAYFSPLSCSRPALLLHVLYAP